MSKVIGCAFCECDIEGMHHDLDCPNHPDNFKRPDAAPPKVPSRHAPLLGQQGPAGNRTAAHGGPPSDAAPVTKWHQERPAWCPHQDCVFSRRSQDALCGGRLPKPEPHEGDENTHRLCIKTGEVFDLQVNKADLGYFRWILDALDGKKTSWLSRDAHPDAAPRAWMHRRRDGKRPADIHPWFLTWRKPSPPPAPYWHEVVALIDAHPEDAPRPDKASQGSTVSGGERPEQVEDAPEGPWSLVESPNLPDQWVIADAKNAMYAARRVFTKDQMIAVRDALNRRKGDKT